LITPQVSWAEKYRPQNIEDLIFPNPKWKKIINDWISTGKIGGNIALFGPGGFGKSTLTKIICNGILKNAADGKVIKSRSVQEIDTIGEFIRSKPIGSPIKIVVIEEADRLSSQAQNELKEKYTEAFQDHASIIITSNYPFKIDEPLLQRFLYKIDFTHLDQDEVFARLMFILKQENCKVNETELKNWIENNSFRGLRNMINSLQLTAKMNNNLIVFEDISAGRDLENKVIILCQNILSNFMSCKDVTQKKASFINPVSSEIIGPQWTELTQIIQNNYGINYRLVLEEIEQSIRFLPLKNIIRVYLEEVDLKKYQQLHLIGCISDMLKCINEVT